MINVEEVLKTLWRCLENVWKIPWRHLRKTSCKRLGKAPLRYPQDVLKTPSKRLQDILKMSWRRLEDAFTKRLKDALKRPLENILKTSGKRMTNVNIFIFIKTSWRRLEDVFWRCMTKTSIFVLIKTPWGRLHQDKCLLGIYRDKQVRLKRTSFYLREKWLKRVKLWRDTQWSSNSAQKKSPKTRYP